MTEQEALNLMVAPGTRRPGKYREGVIQVWVTRACDKACFNCTQGSNLAGKPEFITPAQFKEACLSLKGYFGVVGMFGGNPAMHPQFETLCRIMTDTVPPKQRGIWSNSPITLDNAKIMRETFTPSVSNLNVHLDYRAYKLFKKGWPESQPVGLTQDSRHSPPFVAMKDVLWKMCPECKGESEGMNPIASLPASISQWVICPTCRGTGKVYDEEQAWSLISKCDINQHWSAMIGVFRGALRAWFCEIAGAQSMLHQWDKSGDGVEDFEDYDYPDTGMIPIPGWWRLPMQAFASQVRKHCHECSVPLRGHGELAQADELDRGGAFAKEQTSTTHANIYKPKRKGRQVEIVTEMVQLGVPLDRMTAYLQNSSK